MRFVRIPRCFYFSIKTKATRLTFSGSLVFSGVNLISPLRTQRAQSFHHFFSAFSAHEASAVKFLATPFNTNAPFFIKLE